MGERKKFSHFKIEGGKMPPKKGYNTEIEAINIARFLNTKENIIHKMVAYKCPTCGKYHVGKNGTELTDEDREHYKKLLLRYKKIGI
jgi:hypothetical protein